MAKSFGNSEARGIEIDIGSEVERFSHILAFGRLDLIPDKGYAKA